MRERGGGGALKRELCFMEGHIERSGVSWEGKKEGSRINFRGGIKKAKKKSRPSTAKAGVAWPEGGTASQGICRKKKAVSLWEGGGGVEGQRKKDGQTAGTFRGKEGDKLKKQRDTILPNLPEKRRKAEKLLQKKRERPASSRDGGKSIDGRRERETPVSSGEKKGTVDGPEVKEREKNKSSAP